MGKKGFLLIDGCKNCVILSPDEIKGTELHDFLMKNGIMAKVRRNKNMTELNKSVREYLPGGWSDEEVNDEDDH